MEAVIRVAGPIPIDGPAGEVPVAGPVSLDIVFPQNADHTLTYEKLEFFATRGGALLPSRAVPVVELVVVFMFVEVN